MIWTLNCEELNTLFLVLNSYPSIVTFSDFFTGCKHTLNDSFGHLNITYNEKFSPDCIWKILNSGISEPVAIVSIEKVQFGYCRYVFLWSVALFPVTCL